MRRARCRRPVRFVALPVLALLSLQLTACDSGGNTKAPGLTGHVSETDPRWPYWPAGLRLHPLTRLVTDESGVVLYIEARVEFHDPEGHTTKACGELRLEAHDGLVRSDAAPLVWERMDLGDLEFNHTYFDEITRTYVFRLEIAEDQVLPAQPILVAFYLAARGETLTAAPLAVRVN